MSLLGNAINDFINKYGRGYFDNWKIYADEALCYFSIGGEDEYHHIYVPVEGNDITENNECLTLTFGNRYLYFGTYTEYYETGEVRYLRIDVHRDMPAGFKLKGYAQDYDIKSYLRARELAWNIMVENDYSPKALYYVVRELGQGYKGLVYCPYNFNSFTDSESYQQFNESNNYNGNKESFEFDNLDAGILYEIVTTSYNQ